MKIELLTKRRKKTPDISSNLSEVTTCWIKNKKKHKRKKEKFKEKDRDNEETEKKRCEKMTFHDTWKQKDWCPLNLDFLVRTSKKIPLGWYEHTASVLSQRGNDDGGVATPPFIRVFVAYTPSVCVYMRAR